MARHVVLGYANDTAVIYPAIGQAATDSETRSGLVPRGRCLERCLRSFGERMADKAG